MKGNQSARTVKTVRCVKIIGIVLTTVLAVFFAVKGTINVFDVSAADGYTLKGTDTFIRVTEQGEEEYEDETVCPVEYKTADGKYTLTKNYTFDEWESLPTGDTVTGYIYENADGSALCYPNEATVDNIKATLKDENAVNSSTVFGVAMALALVAIALVVLTCWDRFFTAYEQIWFISIMVIAAIISVVAPEEDCNGVSGLLIMALYLADTFLNILCELLISKQSKWNFIVSIFVEITEIVTLIVLSYRFATLASTLFFWLPCDIISFINWHRHPDKVEDDLTQVRTLKGWQEAAIIAGIVVWTVGIGYFLTTLDIGTDFLKGSDTLKIVLCYFDACVSAVGIVNGVFILLRLREQWIAWYISAVLEAIINIMSGQFVLLVLKIGYITNTTYGYIKWTKYIKAANKSEQGARSKEQ